VKVTVRVFPRASSKSHGGVCGWGPGRGSGAGRTGPRGGSTSMGGRVESICTPSRAARLGRLRQWTVVGGGGARGGGAGRRDPAHRIGGSAGAVGRRRRGSSAEPAPQGRGDPQLGRWGGPAPQRLPLLSTKGW